MYRTAFCVYTCKSVLATTGQYSVHCLCQGKTLIGALASFPGLPPPPVGIFRQTVFCSVCRVIRRLIALYQGSLLSMVRENGARKGRGGSHMMYIRLPNRCTFDWLSQLSLAGPGHSWLQHRHSSHPHTCIQVTNRWWWKQSDPPS